MSNIDGEKERERERKIERMKSVKKEESEDGERKSDKCCVANGMEAGIEERWFCSVLLMMETERKREREREGEKTERGKTGIVLERLPKRENDSAVFRPEARFEYLFVGILELGEDLAEPSPYPALLKLLCQLSNLENRFSG